MADTAPLASIARRQHIVAKGDQRFLMNTVVENLGTSRITVVLNWKPQN
jgi:hypothetical protein